MKINSLKKFISKIRSRYSSTLILDNRRAISSRIFHLGHFYYQKTFKTENQAAFDCFQNELLAYELFKNKPWINPIIRRLDNGYITKFYDPNKHRLDRIAPGLSLERRQEIALKMMNIIFDIFQAGYAHRDFHSKNILLVRDSLFLVDFETICMYPPNEIPPFPVSYDLIGSGLVSPYYTQNMCYQAKHKTSLENSLGVPLDEALLLFSNQIKKELLEASITFQASKKRHTCLSEKIYASFDLPYLKVTKQESQRDSDQRFSKFGISYAQLNGKSIVDLGCNTGGMIFAAQKFAPALCYGYEIDQDKVAIAAKIAKFNGLNAVHFVQADIDQLDIDEKFDVVFCFAIESHVKDKEHLYNLLGKITSGTLYFEGNEGTKIDEVISLLTERGFEVEFIGMCDDDRRSENNVRPLFVAKKISKVKNL